MATYDESDDDLGGESSCYAHLLCQECGAVLDKHHDARHLASDAPSHADESTR